MSALMRMKSDAAVDRVRQTMRASRLNYAHEISKVKHTMFSSLTSAVVGLCEARGKTLPSIVGVDGELAFGTVALVAAGNSTGETAKVLQSLADALLAVGAYKIGLTYGANKKINGLGSVGGVTPAQTMDALLSEQFNSAG